MNPTLSDLIALHRTIGIAEARGKINNKTQSLDYKARQMRKEYTNSQIKQRQRMQNGFRTKHK